MKTYKILLAGLVLVIFLSACSHKGFDAKWTKVKAPASFRARFETTKGAFEIESVRAWSPLAVDRLYQLIVSGFYTDIGVFRIDSGYVVQFGISGDTMLNHRWEKYKLPDERVIEKNLEGTIAFARGGPESRATQIFVNTNKNSPYLDNLFYGQVAGFPVVAKVTKGMDVIKSFYGKYKGEPANHQQEIYSGGNAYLRKAYPKLDYIKKATIIK